MLVLSVGDVPNTHAPVPVSSVSTAARLALDAVCQNVSIPDATVCRPVPPAPMVSGVVSVAARFAPDGVTQNVDMPAPRTPIPVPPLTTGKIPLTSVPLSRTGTSAARITVSEAR